MMTAIDISKNSGVQPQHEVGANAPGRETQVKDALKHGAGGLQGHMVAVGDGVQTEELFARATEMLGTSESPIYGSPYDDPAIDFEEGLELLNRDSKLHQELKEAVMAKESQSPLEAARRSEIFQQLEKQIEANRLLSLDGQGSELSREDPVSDEFFQAAKALSQHSKGNSIEWLLLKSEASLQDAKHALAKLEVEFQESRLPEEDKAPLRAKLEMLKADVAKWELRLEAINARVASGKVDEARQQLPVTQGGGEKRAETLGWATRAKQAFTSFFASVASGLAAAGRFVAALPGLLLDSLTGDRGEKAQLNQYLGKFLQLPLDPDDKRAASTSGNTQHICHGMAKDLPRVDVLIGGVLVDRRAKNEESSVEKLNRESAQIEKAATELLKECGGNKDLCMRVSQFAFQATESFWANAVKEGRLTPEGAPDGIRFQAPDPETHRIEVVGLPGVGVQLIFTAEHPRMKGIPLASEMKVIELDPEKSAFNTRFSIVVRPDLTVEPYPLNAGSGDSSALSYEFYITPDQNLT